MLIDLQLHSTYSDGYLSPSQLAGFIAGQGVKVAALTDHNTVGGQVEFKRACRRYRLKAVTGLEVYAKLNQRKINLLWYNFDDNHPELHELLRESQQRRRRQVRLMLKKLLRRGFKFNINKILDQYSHYLALNHIIDDIMAVPDNRNKAKRELNNKSPREEDIVGRYFRNRRIGVLHETYLNIERLLKLKKKIGGQLILNHPAKHHYIRPELWLKLKQLKLDGVEILSPHHSVGAVMYIQQLARELNFIESGGSDFHRPEGGNFPLQNSWQYFKIEAKYLRRINKIIG